MPLRAGGMGEKKATRISTHQLHRQGSHRQWDLDEEWCASGVAGVVDLDAEFGLWPFHRVNQMIGDLGFLVGEGDILGAGVGLCHGDRKSTRLNSSHLG